MLDRVPDLGDVHVFGPQELELITRGMRVREFRASRHNLGGIWDASAVVHGCGEPL
jgi:hypothetical protein